MADRNALVAALMGGQPQDQQDTAPKVSPSLLDKLAQTWPARLAKDAYNAVTLPGDVAQGNVSMYGDDGHTNPEVINRSADLAGLVTGGSYAAPAMKDASGMGIRAYHGSPHDFDRFDLSKIGTGEGAQAYGHGLYFAENEGVARGYRDTLSNDYMRTPQGTLFDPQTLEHMNIRSRAHSNGSNIDDTIERARALVASQAGIPAGEMASRDLARLEQLKAEGGLRRHNGRMYEVNINADPAKFLDWDKPLAGQSAEVRAAIQNVSPAQSRVQRQITDETLTGPGVYHAPLSMDARGALRASEFWKDQGIPGIKYLDQGSRGAGNGSSNYVVFNDKLIDILRKYGIAGVPAAGVAGAAAMQPDDKS